MLEKIFKDKEFRTDCILTSIIFFIAFCLRFTALNPLALWNDDAWVGLISKAHDLKSFILISSHSPILFSVMQFIASKIISDKELSMQFLPFIFSLLQIIIFYFLTKELSKNKTVAFLSAFLLAVSPNMIDYSARAKQFVFDSFSSISIIYFYIKYLKNNYNIKHYISFLIMSFVFFLGSYTSIIISIILIHIFIFNSIKKNRNKAYLITTIIFDFFIFLYYLFFIKNHINAAMQNFWKDYYIDFSTNFVNSFFNTTNKLAIFITQPFTKITTFSANNTAFAACILILIIFGFIYLKNQCKDLFTFYILFFISIFSLAFLHKYPIASARSDMYSYPIIIILASLGIYQIKNFLIKNDKIWLILIILICITSLFFTNFSTYKTSLNTKTCFEKIDNELQPDNFLLLDTAGIYEYAYYTKKSINLKADDSVTMGFLPAFENNYGILPFRYIEDYGYLQGNYDIFDKIKNYDKIFFYSSNFNTFVYNLVDEKILVQNFIKSYSKIDDCILFIYEKPKLH